MAKTNMFVTQSDHIKRNIYEKFQTLKVHGRM